MAERARGGDDIRSKINQIQNYIDRKFSNIQILKITVTRKNYKFIENVIEPMHQPSITMEDIIFQLICKEISDLDGSVITSELLEIQKQLEAVAKGDYTPRKINSIQRIQNYIASNFPHIPINIQVTENNYKAIENVKPILPHYPIRVEDIIFSLIGKHVESLDRVFTEELPEIQRRLNDVAAGKTAVVSASKEELIKRFQFIFKELKEKNPLFSVPVQITINESNMDIFKNTFDSYLKRLKPIGQRELLHDIYNVNSLQHGSSSSLAPRERDDIQTKMNKNMMEFMQTPLHTVERKRKLYIKNQCKRTNTKYNMNILENWIANDNFVVETVLHQPTINIISKEIMRKFLINLYCMKSRDPQSYVTISTMALYNLFNKFLSPYGECSLSAFLRTNVDDLRYNLENCLFQSDGYTVMRDINLEFDCAASFYDIKKYVNATFIIDDDKSIKHLHLVRPHVGFVADDLNIAVFKLKDDRYMITNKCETEQDTLQFLNRDMNRLLESCTFQTILHAQMPYISNSETTFNVCQIPLNDVVRFKQMRLGDNFEYPISCITRLNMTAHDNSDGRYSFDPLNQSNNYGIPFGRMMIGVTKTLFIIPHSFIFVIVNNIGNIEDMGTYTPRKIPVKTSCTF